jgi:hypothetical protein
LAVARRDGGPGPRGGGREFGGDDVGDGVGNGAGRGSVSPRRVRPPVRTVVACARASKMSDPETQQYLGESNTALSGLRRAISQMSMLVGKATSSGEVAWREECQKYEGVNYLEPAETQFPRRFKNTNVLPPHNPQPTARLRYVRAARHLADKKQRFLAKARRAALSSRMRA